jgi:hypothetical protein
VFVHGVTDATGSLQELANVMLDPTTGATTTIPNAPGATSVGPAQADPFGIYWETDGPGPEFQIWRYAETSTPICTVGYIDGFAADGAELFFVEDFQRFKACPLGGPTRVLKDATDGAVYELVALDASDVYYSRNPVDSSSYLVDGELRAMARDGSADRLIASGYALGDARADATHIYWDGDGLTVQRVRKDGGAVERVMTLGGSRVAHGMDIDERNVYVTVAHPPAILVCAK